MIEVKDVAKKLGITVAEFYEYAGTTQQNLSYHKKNNPIVYENYLYGGICRYYGLNALNLTDLMQSLHEIEKILEELRSEKNEKENAEGGRR